MQRRQGQRLSVHCRGHPHRSTHTGGPRVQELAKPWQSCGLRRACACVGTCVGGTGHHDCLVGMGASHVSRFDRSPRPPAPFHTTSLKLAGYLGSCALYCTTGVPPALMMAQYRVLTFIAWTTIPSMHLLA
jgi:hypothetical protein